MTTWLSRLKNLEHAKGDATKATKPPFVAFVASVLTNAQKNKGTESNTTDVQELPPVDIGTIRPAGLSGKFLEASQQLDRQIAAQDLQHREHLAQQATAEALQKFALPALPVRRWDTAQIPAYTPTGKVQQQHHHHLDAPWRPLARAYYTHHVNCQLCQSAGKGYGELCSTGADLWVKYQDNV